MFRRFLSLILFGLLCGVGISQAQVVLPGMATDPTWLSIDYVRVNVGIDQQIAETSVSMQFTNNGEQMAEGTFLFPLPRGAAVDKLTMTVNGVTVDAKILKADEARQIYDEIVRQYRDPALLEYVGRDLIQANVFPIPPRESRQLEIRYGQFLTLENGLVNFSYPIKAPANAMRLIKQFSIRVEASDNAPLTNVYSPSHRIALSRPEATRFVAGFEASNYTPDADFDLFYGIQRQAIDANLLTYKESATADGFFLLMVQPPQSLPEAQIQPKDVVIVLDQSGSMEGEKWTQAQQAALYVLENLKPQDRFNVVAFSTGWRNYANEMLPASDAPRAADWIRTLYAEGGTDIHSALWTAFQYTDSERPMTILFMTDGLATEGLTETGAILESLKLQDKPNVRVFSFGVGDDVDTLLLDSLVRDFRGVGSYVRPYERIEEEVASLYNKISAPVMTDISLSFDGVIAELLYPQTLPDLFAGEQLTLVGRYRNADATSKITLTGKQNGQVQTLVYDDLSFDNRAGGTEFIARLWATRRIGDLLNSIRLNGESEELVNSVVELSIRYGIITPYTSFLIEEDDVLSAEGRARAEEAFSQQGLSNMVTGSGAVDAADMVQGMQAAGAPQDASALRQIVPPPAPMQQSQTLGGMSNSMPAITASPMGTMSAPVMAEAERANGADEAAQSPIRIVRDQTFILQSGIWTQTTYQPDNMTPIIVEFLSDAYFDLLARYPEAAEYLAIGEEVIVVLEGQAYQIVSP